MVNPVSWNRRRGYSRSEVELIQTVVGTTVDGVWGPETVAAVKGWQDAQGLVVDGLVGPITWAAIQEHTDGLAPPGPPPQRLRWAEVPADEWSHGYDRFTLRQDVAKAYWKVYRELSAEGGQITSSGGRRRLTAHVGPNRSATSLHYTGRALDLYAYSGMVDPKTDPLVVTADPHEKRCWVVYARIDEGDEVELPAITYESRKKPIKVTGRFRNLTKLFRKHGFERIRARASFLDGGARGGAEWWHFQWEEGLVSGQTTFGDELLRIYTEVELKGTPPWKYRRRVWGENWG
jgi:hypothetical protein